MNNTAEDLSQHLAAIRAMNSVDQETMLEAARGAYQKAIQTRAQAIANVEAANDKIRELAEARNTGLNTQATAQYSIERNLQIIQTLEIELRPKSNLRAAQ